MPVCTQTHTNMCTTCTQTKRVQSGVLAPKRSAHFACLQDSTFLHPLSLFLLLSCHLCAFIQVLLSPCEARRPLVVSKRHITLRRFEGVGEKKTQQRAGTHYFSRYWTVDGVSGREGVVEGELKWISSEKANCRIQIQGCFWLVFPLLFRSGRRRSNSRGCPFSC